MVETDILGMLGARFRRAAFTLPVAAGITFAAYLTVRATVELFVVGFFHFAYMLSLLLAFFLLRSYRLTSDRSKLIAGYLSVLLSVPGFVAFYVTSNEYFPRPLSPTVVKDVLIGVGLAGGVWAVFAAFALEPLLVSRERE